MSVTININNAHKRYGDNVIIKDLCKLVRSLRNGVVASGSLSPASCECYALVQY